VWSGAGLDSPWGLITPLAGDPGLPSRMPKQSFKASVNEMRGRPGRTDLSANPVRWLAQVTANPCFLPRGARLEPDHLHQALKRELCDPCALQSDLADLSQANTVVVTNNTTS
jgi:hypothetical protein